MTPEQRQARSERAAELWQRPGHRERVSASMARSREDRSEAMRWNWRDPQYRSKRPGLLPPMTDDQRRAYKRLRKYGIGREESLMTVLGRGRS